MTLRPHPQPRPREGVSLSLTARLALTGLASALVPFLAAALVLAFAPASSSDTKADLDNALARSGVHLQQRRVQLVLALAHVSDQDLVRFTKASDEQAIAQLVQGQLDAAEGDKIQAKVRISSPNAQASVTSSVEESLLVGTGASARQITVSDLGAGASLKDEAGIGLALVQPGRMAAVSRSARAWKAVVNQDGHVRFGGNAPAHWRSATIDDATHLQLVAGSEDPVGLARLVHSQSRDVALALALLLATGLICALAMALVMNRLLGSLAERAKLMADGDFDRRLAVVGSDAGAKVSESLNDLAAQLQVRIGSLEHTVEHLDRTLAAIGDGVCARDESGRVETWNQAAAQLTGVDADAAKAGSAPAEFLARPEQMIPGERRVLLPIGDGANHIVVDLAVTSMRQGGTLQVFGDASRELSIERARANFMVTAAHELRTPLTSIMGFAATLSDPDLKLSEEVKELSLRQVLEQAERLNEVVSSLVESSLIVQDKIEVSLQEVDLADLVRSVASANGIAAEISQSPSVRADRQGLERALDAVLDNAHKYGKDPIGVTIEIDDVNAFVIVRDHGEGIDEAMHEVIFEPFSRVDPQMRSEVGGAGMGLYSARRLVEAMGGALTLREHSGDGAEFALAVPLHH